MLADHVIRRDTGQSLAGGDDLGCGDAEQAGVGLI
jgi:hypothetical protein